MLTVGSLFAGIGGFDLGLERTGGFRVVWQCEIDPYCQRVLAKHWPDVQRYGDIRTLADVERVDVLCGGFPCQDISNAGNRTGIDGERSGLWSEYVRVIRLLRPCYVLVENVAALLGRGMGRVLGDLSESGYDAEWDVIPASAVGAPHRRERVWIVAYPSSERGRGGQHSNRSGSEAAYRGAALADTDSARRSRQGLQGAIGNGGASDADSQRCEELFVTAVAGYQEQRRWSIDAARCEWASEPNVGRVAHGIPARMDRLKGLGNAIVPQIAEWIGNRILEYEGVR